MNLAGSLSFQFFHTISSSSSGGQVCNKGCIRDGNELDRTRLGEKTKQGRETRVMSIIYNIDGRAYVTV